MVALALTVTACEDDESAASTTSSTTTTVAGGASGGTVDTVPDTATPTPETDPAGTPRPTTATSPTPDSTVPPSAPPAAPPSAPTANDDTGLPPGSPAAPPAPTDFAEEAVVGQATIVVEGPFPLSLSGGLCSYYESTVFVQAGQVSADFITLSWAAPSSARDVVTDPSQIGAPQVGWESGGTNALSYPEETHITFDETGAIAGSFAGHAVLARPNATEQIDFTGRFSCLPAPIDIQGPHPVQLTEARCTESGVSAGSPTTNAALLSFDPATIGDGDNVAAGALTYRYNGVVYTSTWVQIDFSDDGVAGRFIAEMRGPGGGPFTVTGAFSCLGQT